MNKSAFLKLIQQVSGISDQQAEELEKVAAAFPYCQTAHLLLAKSAYDKGSMLSAQRLRRASAYATDRQLLKRLIYTSPAPVTAFDEAAIPEDESVSGHIAAEEVNIEALPPIHPDIQEDKPEESLPPAGADTGGAPSAEEVPEDPGTAAEPVEPEEPEDTELSRLLTINSLNASFTDLLAQKAEKQNPEQEQPAAPAPPDPLDQPEITEPENIIEVPEDGVLLSDVLDCTFENIDMVLASIPAPAAPPDMAEEQPESMAAPVETDKPAPQPETEDEQAEINYNTHEIDRLYAEDVLGYWMASSRMGEVLQLKDDYTRVRPQSFHPELILEYSKTHELEKAVQPGNNTLSDQLNIIDQFLKLNPRLKTMANVKVKPEPQEDLSLKSSKIKKGIASESLANIFLQQGKIRKAIKIYELLILKYPEKKSYFAEQIEKLQNQI